MTRIRKATPGDLPEIESLLATAQLPNADVAQHAATFFVADDEGSIIGVGGFEDCGAGAGLLRSFVVSSRYRSRGVGRRLFDQVIAECRRRNILSLYLLTATAKDYFARLGFIPIPRDEAPESIRHTGQFRGLCPISTVLMFLDLSNRDSDFMPPAMA